MDLSIIVVNYNGREMTRACLASLAASTTRTREVIVIDNGSRDGSADEIAREAPSVRLVRNPENRGFAAAVNQGIRMATGSYLLLLNNDARPGPGSLDLLMIHLDTHPEAGMAGPQLVHEDGRLQNSFDNLPTPAASLMNKALLRLFAPGSYPSKRTPSPEPQEVESLIGASLMVRRSLVDRIGMLDEDYFIFLEETDWCLRARQEGQRVVLVPESRVVHLQGRTRERARVRAKIEYTRSLFTYFRKHYRGSYPFLRLMYPVKSAAGLASSLAGTLVSLFLWKRMRRRLAEQSALLAWQLLFCPASFGLAPRGWPRVPWRRDPRHG